jgi:hypothetical protein
MAAEATARASNYGNANCSPGQRDRPRHRRASPAAGNEQWNAIEHRLLFVRLAEREGETLVSSRVIVDLIGATTETGLTVRCEPDGRT